MGISFEVGLTRRPCYLLPGPADHGSHARDGRRVGRWRDRQGLTRLILVHLLLPLFALTGCESMGPGSVTRDRFDYSEAVGESWKTQMLLNLVKVLGEEELHDDSDHILDDGSAGRRALPS